MASGKVNLYNYAPDYANKQLITALRELNGTYTVPENGFIFAGLIKNNDDAISEYIVTSCGITVIRYYSSARNYNSAIIPVKKGDVLSCTTSVNMYWADNYGPYFIPLCV